MSKTTRANLNYEGAEAVYGVWSRSSRSLIFHD